MSNMNNIMSYEQFSPLYPLKGRIAANIGLHKLATITPLRACPDYSGGQGVSIKESKIQ